MFVVILLMLKKSIKLGVDECDSIDILFNCTGIAFGATMDQTEDDMFKKAQDVNVFGTFLMMKCVYMSCQMIESGNCKEGVIINMSSVVLV